MEITTASPVEIDTKLAEIYVRGYEANGVVTQIAHWLKNAKESLAKKAAGERFYSSASPEYVTELEAKLAVARETASAVWALTAPFDAEFDRRGGWSRLYLVDNSGGHVHSTMDCKTCFTTTEFVWLPEYSDKPATEVVEAAGALTCLTCFGSVRETIRRKRGVDPTKAKTAIEAPARKAARLEREAKAAAKAEKVRITGITDAETGGPLRIKEHSYGETLNTVRTARIWLTDSYGPYAYSRDAANLARVVAAIAKKEGKDEATVIAEAKQRAAKRK